MNRRLWYLAIAFMAMPIYSWWHGTSSPAVAGPEQLPFPREAPASPQFLGAGSCAAVACHNSNSPHSTQTRGEYATWITRDPHAKAFEILFDDRSAKIQQELHRSLPAHKDQRCLSCHVAPEYDAANPPVKAPHFKSDGVSCESCHGPASQWIGLHHLNTWQVVDAAEKKQLGMNDTRSLDGRAQICATCHVGKPGMDIDHDLIAAGHPRLQFELSAFHAHMPRHWPDAKDRAGHPDFDARLWAIGQLASAEAALELLAHRADEKKTRIWPEFAEHDCAACHHDLRSPSKFPVRGTKLVPVPWNSWNLAMTAEIMAAFHSDTPAFANLRKEMAKGWNNRRGINKSASSAAIELHAIMKSADSALPTNLSKIVLADNERLAGKEWDRTAQIALALAALEQGASADRPAIRGFWRGLELPKYYDDGVKSNPDSEAVRARLLEFKTRAAKKEQ